MGAERIAVSGASGFLGNSLVERLDNPIKLNRSGNAPQADHYFDLASYGNLYNQTDVYETYNANVVRLLNLLTNVNEYDYRSFIVTSSSSVTLPHQTAYSESKKAAEGIAKLFADKFDKPVVIVRPYSITGVGEQPQHLIPKLIDSCLNGTPMQFVPEPVHDFLDVEDFTDALLLISQNAKNHKGQVFPVGSGVQYSNAEVLEIVQNVTGKKANIEVVKSMREYDTTDWRADTTRLYSLGWQPNKSLEQSVGEMVLSYVVQIQHEALK